MIQPDRLPKPAVNWSLVCVCVREGGGPLRIKVTVKAV